MTPALLQFIPPDNDYYRREYESKEKGICGLAVLAVLFRTTIDEILDAYQVFLKKEYPSYLSLKDLRAFLSHHGYKTMMKNGHKAKTFPLPEEDGTTIARIQWEGSDGGKYHGYRSWQEATCNTHWVLIMEHEGTAFVFCNGEGWFNNHDYRYREYLKPGYITSYLEVWRS